MVPPLASQYVPKIKAVAPLGTTIMLRIPRGEQGCKMGKSVPEEAALPLPVQFLSSASKAKPLPQRHLKLPMVFRQVP